MAVAAALAACCGTAAAQADESVPYYFGGSAGVSHVSNLYHEASGGKNDTVASIGLLGGVDERLGRQHLKVDGFIQDNRYSQTRELNNQSYSLNTALDWETVGHLSGTLGAKSDRSLADFNIGNGVTQIFKKNTERNDEYQAVARLGMGTRYSLEAGWLHRRRDFSAEEYDRFVYQQSTTTLGVYATPAGNLKLGLVGRHTSGKNPRYPVGLEIVGNPPEIRVRTEVNDYSRNDLDFTTRWSTGGRSTLNTRISRSRTKNGLDNLRDFNGTTGSVGWNWQPTAKLQFGVQLSRDTGQESFIRAPDVNRIYHSWQLTGAYALTSKLNFTANASEKRTRRSTDPTATITDTFESIKTYGAGLRWAFSRGISVSCQYDHAGRDSSVPQYIYSANSYGCSGQAIFF